MYWISLPERIRSTDISDGKDIKKQNPGRDRKNSEEKENVQVLDAPRMLCDARFLSICMYISVIRDWNIKRS